MTTPTRSLALRLSAALACATWLAGAAAQEIAKPAASSPPEGTRSHDTVPAARSVAVAPAGGGTITAAPIAPDGTFRITGLAPGAYRLAVTSTTVPKQTQGATFGERVNAGLSAAGSAVAVGESQVRHEAAMDSVRNVKRAAGPDTGAEPPAAARSKIDGGMPNRISMNVSVGRQTQGLELDGGTMAVEVGGDGVITGRVVPR